MAYPKYLSQSVAAAIAALGLLSLAPAALAQSTTGTDPTQAPRVNAAEGFGSSDASGGLFGESGSPFDLIHRAVLMNERSVSDFRRQHRGRIGTEADNFRTLQQEAIQRQQLQTQPADMVAPAAGE
ncbi:hypothetical protein [Leptolyngbya sp. KIOST-1]|uniref:hypothetical protein n=1 Tax=Leptolyngbya sp. KIOST-1 TaxID=1229172 RepID=UPI000563C365|nr:hypothetical protein [Leptolyngbya sp. KIOST-1]